VVSGKEMQQAVLSFSENGTYREIITIPSPVSRELSQIGLRRFMGSFLWLEWSEHRALLRTWNPRTKTSRTYEIDSSLAVGPGFAVWQKDESSEPLVALNDRNGISLFALGAGSLERRKRALYPEGIAKYVADPESTWQPGAIFSAAADSQLFAILPFTWGKVLFAVDGGSTFRLLSHESCANPDFYLVNNQ
jgi:hypothetical protein